MRRFPRKIAALALLTGCQSTVSLDGLQFGPGYAPQDVSSSPDNAATSDLPAPAEDVWWRGNFDATLYCDNGSCGGACTNGTDQGQALDQGTVTSKLMTAMQTCLIGAKYGASCVSTAMQTEPKPFFSAMCADCFGSYYACGIASCAGACLPSTSSPQCAECFQLKCSPGFAQCSGWLVSW